MARHVLLLRGINLGASRRIPMAELRALLGEAGFSTVQTYVQSGNVVLETPMAPTEVQARARELISERFGFDVPVIVRSRRELAAVVERDPHAEVAGEPKLYQVTFLDQPITGEVRARLAGLVAGGEQLVADGRELYSWHPDGIARSKLATALAGDLGVAASARNWRTVTTLLEMAQGS